MEKRRREKGKIKKRGEVLREICPRQGGIDASAE